MVRNNVQEMKLLGKELVGKELSTERDAGGGVGTEGGSPVLSPPPGSSLSFLHPAPLSPQLPLLSTCWLCVLTSQPPAGPHLRNPALSASSSALPAQGNRERVPSPPHTHAHTRIHTHCGHNTSTQGCGSKTLERAIYYPRHSGPSRPLKLPWNGPLLAKPGPNASTSPLLGPPWGWGGGGLSPLQALP